MNILVVDDEKEIADIVELYLKGDQYNIYKCYNGTDAWNLVQMFSCVFGKLQATIENFLAVKSPFLSSSIKASH